MYADFYPSDEYETEDAVDLAWTGASLTEDVLSDPAMSKDQKRSLLASWASDFRAVENSPALRRLDDGTVLHIDAILGALKALDLPAEGRGGRSNILSFPVDRVGHRPRGERPEDDDPPPTPLAMALPKPQAVLNAFASGFRANRWHASVPVVSP